MASERGFSLIEMLAALGVLAVAGLALTHALTTSARAAVFAQERGLAAVAAENVLSLEVLQGEFIPGAPPRTGEYAIAGREYRWRLTAETAADPALIELTLIVSDPDGEGELYRLTTFQRAS